MTNYATDALSRAVRGGMRGATGSDNHGQMLVPLSNDDLHRLAPSVFATEPHQSRSNKFVAISTIGLIDGMREHGFLPFAAKQAKARDESKKDFTKHLIRFRREADAGSWQAKDTIPEIVLVNANDGSSSYQLFGGLFRFLCFNGLVVGDSIQSIRIGHKGKIVDQVVEGSYAILEQTGKAMEVKQEWQHLQLTAPEAQIFANSAHTLRFGDIDTTKAVDAVFEEAPIKAHQLLIPRRQEDKANDLWTVFNRVQENVVKGGLVGHTKAGFVKDDKGNETYKRSRRVTTREVKGIDQDVKLNKALWTLAEQMAALKKAA